MNTDPTLAGWPAPAHPVLMLAYHYPPENKIGAARPHRFARHLQQRGHSVSVVAADVRGAGESAGNIVRAPRDSNPGRVARSSSALLGLVERHILPCRDYLPWVPHAVAAASARIASEPGQVVFSTSPPVATHLAALLLKWRHGVPWIADFRDPFWGNPTRTARRSAAMGPLLERLIFQNADAVIANTDAVAALWSRRYPRWTDKIHVIWNGFDPDDRIEPLPREERIQRRISHVGALYGDRTPLAVASSLERLIASGVLAPGGAQLRLVGPITDRARRDLDAPVLRRLAEHQHLHVDDRTVPQDEARREMLQADWLLLLDLNDRNPGLQLPAKLFDYVRAGRPILAFTNPGSPTERVLARSGVPHACIDPAAPSLAMDAQVASFLRQPLVDAAPSRAFWSEFDARRQTAILARLVRTVAAPLEGFSAGLPASTHASAGYSQSFAALLGPRRSSRGRRAWLAAGTAADGESSDAFTA